MQALWMLLAAWLFASMGLCIKIASPHFTSMEIVASRGLIGVVFMLALMRWRRVPLKTPVPAMHAWRSLVGTVALATWFHAIAGLPLATAMTLNYMSSVWMAAFLVGGALLTQQPGDTLRQQGPLVLTVLAGFGGVALMLRPTFTPEQGLPGLSGLLSGVVSALAYLQVAALARAGEPESRTVFYFSVGAALVGLLGVAATGRGSWTWAHTAWLLPIGVLGVLGQLCMTRAYARGGTLVVASLQYMGIVFASLYGLWWLNERLPWPSWLGMGLIIASGLVATRLRTRAAPQTTALPANSP